MKFALYLPNAGYYAEPELLIDIAVAAEASGWDGLFLWDHLLLGGEHTLPLCDTWTAVTAILTRTRRLIAGPLVTPLARRRPAKVARETVTLSRLSDGRLVLGAGLGGDPQAEFGAFGEPTEAATRAAVLDETLDVIRMLWTGTEQSYQGARHRLDRVQFLPAATPRIPVWAAATWPHRRPLARAARCDGLVPMVRHSGSLRGPDPTELSQILSALPHPVAEDFDVAVPGVLQPDSPAAAAAAATHHAAGATWWLESFDPWRRHPRELHQWLEQGPPRGDEPVTTSDQRTSQ